MQHHPAVAYALWLVGGWLGLHHLYLNRPHAAFLSVITLQGFGISWLSDLLAMPQLVAQQNADAEYLATLRVAHAFRAKPPLSLLASLVQILSGTLFGAIAACLVPAQYPELVYEVLFAVGAAWGITSSGDAIDLETQGNLRWVVLSVVTFVVVSLGVYGWDASDEDYRSVKAAAVFLGVGVYLWTRRWSARVDALLLQVPEKVEKQHSEVSDASTIKVPRPAYWKTLLTYWALLTIFTGCCTTAVVFHGVVRMEVDGVVTETPFFEACHNFVQSEAFQMFTATMYDLYMGKPFEEQFHDRWYEFHAKMDLSGRHRHLKVLGLARDASDKEIKTAYRKLVLEWHPDKYTGEDREHAHAKFLQIQEAYEQLIGSQAERRRTGPVFESNDEL